MGAKRFPQPESHRRKRFTTSDLLNKVVGEEKLWICRLTSKAPIQWGQPPWGAKLFPQPESHTSRRFRTSGLLSKVVREKKIGICRLTPKTPIQWRQPQWGQDFSPNVKVIEGGVLRLPAFSAKLERRKKYVNRRGLLPAAGGCGALRVATRGGWWRRSATDRDTTVVGTVAHTRHYLFYWFFSL